MILLRRMCQMRKEWWVMSLSLILYLAWLREGARGYHQGRRSRLHLDKMLSVSKGKQHDSLPAYSSFRIQVKNVSTTISIGTLGELSKTSRNECLLPSGLLGSLMISVAWRKKKAGFENWNSCTFRFLTCPIRAYFTKTNRNDGKRMYESK